MKFENTEVWGFEHAFRGMRNPKNSWIKNDTIIYDDDTITSDIKGQPLGQNTPMKVYIGPNDMKLAQTLIRSGSEHRKFLRQIFVSVDVTAPLYWWKQMDQYKISTVTNSTSTMHKLTSKPITLDCFETDDWSPELIYYDFISPDGMTQAENTIEMLSDFMIEQLEFLRQKYLETKDKRYWKELVRWLPESWLQKRTWTANYEVLYSIVHQRKNHKLNEWSGIDNPGKDNFIKWAAYQLPYAKQLIFDNKEDAFSN